MEVTRWKLPVIACQAAGESPEKAIPASAALACAQLSIILVDDMLDDDPRGEYRRIGYGNASNFANAFQAAQDLLNKISLPNKEIVVSLMETVVAPVWKLFEERGVSSAIPPMAAWSSDWE